MLTLKELLNKSKNIVAFTGAGVSTESGLPDFRGKDGLWTKNPSFAEMFNIYSFKQKERVREKYWNSRLGMLGDVSPNAGHEALAKLYSDGRLSTVITQNIDGLHQKSGIPDQSVLELHGSMRTAECMGCKSKLLMEEFLRLSTEIPWKPSTYRCETCKSFFKPSVILFGEELDETVYSSALTAACRADLLLILGSSLTVFPAVRIVEEALDGHVPSVIVNTTPTCFDSQAKLVIRASIGETLTDSLE
jgi:NAD-dependent deacetylase